MHKQKTTKLYAGLASIACLCLVVIVAIYIMLPVHKAAAEETTSNDISFSSEVDIFNPQYENESGDISVKSDSDSCIIAPGTSNNGKFSITNKSANRIEATITFKSPYNDKIKEDFPLQIKLIDQDGNFVLGSSSSWESPTKLAALSITTTFEPNETKNYELPWQWPYDSGNDELDTKYGQLAAEGDSSPQFIIAFDIEGQILYETSSSGDNNWVLVVFCMIMVTTASIVVFKSAKNRSSQAKQKAI